MANHPPLDPARGCPCGSGRPFGACCEPLLTGARSAAAPRELMRSRYTAHAIGDEAYLHRTYAATAQTPYRRAKATRRGVQWLKLEIHADGPGPTPDTAFVEFSAHYQEGGRAGTLREKSEFRLINGAWLYTRAL